ncbi:MAG: carboxypeptidase-like regulatory domain-containing protein [Candidatus Odinarchaeota archaeon]
MMQEKRQLTAVFSLACLLFLVMTLTISASGVTIPGTVSYGMRGHVTNVLGNPLAGVTVSMVLNGQVKDTDITDSAGYYRVSAKFFFPGEIDPLPLTFTLKFEKTEYTTKIVTKTVNPGSLVTVDVSLAGPALVDTGYKSANYFGKALVGVYAETYDRTSIGKSDMISVRVTVTPLSDIGVISLILATEEEIGNGVWWYPWLIDESSIVYSHYNGAQPYFIGVNPTGTDLFAEYHNILVSDGREYTISFDAFYSQNNGDAYDHEHEVHCFVWTSDINIIIGLYVPILAQ